MDDLERKAFDYFWLEANPANGLVRDRNQPNSPSSIAATGFGLTALGIGVNHGWITRVQAAERTLATLNTFWNSRQGDTAVGAIGNNGWFYHFLSMERATRYRNSELSSIDTALLLAGMLYSKEFFDKDSPLESEIRRLAGLIYDRVDWRWMANGSGSLSLGWEPETGFIKYRWRGYNEAMVLYLLGIGATTNGLSADQWHSWTSTFSWQTHYGQSYVTYPSLFVHQFSQCWLDLRGVNDDYLRSKGIDYFENSRRATLAQQAYAIANPGKFKGYGTNFWGFTACDGPATTRFRGYYARGAHALVDDGTIAPSAVAASIVFTPQESISALRHFYSEYKDRLWSNYGFKDSFNLNANWWATDVLGIDQGAMLLMIENYRTQSVWRDFMKSPEIKRGLLAAGFRPIVRNAETAKTETVSGQ